MELSNMQSMLMSFFFLVSSLGEKIKSPGSLDQESKAEIALSLDDENNSGTIKIKSPNGEQETVAIDKKILAKFSRILKVTLEDLLPTDPQEIPLPLILSTINLNIAPLIFEALNAIILNADIAPETLTPAQQASLITTIKDKFSNLEIAQLALIAHTLDMPLLLEAIKPLLIEIFCKNSNDTSFVKIIDTLGTPVGDTIITGVLRTNTNISRAINNKVFDILKKEGGLKSMGYVVAQALAWAPKKNYITFALSDYAENNVRTWNTQTNRLLTKGTKLTDKEFNQIKFGFQVDTITWSPIEGDNRYIVNCANPNYNLQDTLRFVMIHELNTFNTSKISRHGEALLTACWSPDATSIAIGSLFNYKSFAGDYREGHTLTIYGSRSNTAVGSHFEGRSFNAIGYKNLAWLRSPDVIVVTDSEKLNMYDPITSRVAKSLIIANINSAKWSPDENQFASTFTENRNKISVYNNDGILLYDFSGHTGNIHVIAWSPDGTLFAAGGENGLFIWDVETRTLKANLTDPIGDITTFSWSGDSKSIVYSAFKPGKYAHGGNTYILDLEKLIKTGNSEYKKITARQLAKLCQEHSAKS